MKKIALVLILFCLLFVSALDSPEAGVGEEDVEAIQDAIGVIPIGDDGKVNFDDMDFKTKADERIAVINKYVGPLSKILFGVELTLSWVFIFSVILWFLLVIIIFTPVSEFFEWNVWGNFLGSGLIATLSMHGFGDNFVSWINSLVTAWYIGFVVVVLAAFFGVIYSVIIRYFGAELELAKKKSDKDKMNRDLAVIDANAKVSEMELKSRS